MKKYIPQIIILLFFFVLIFLFRSISSWSSFYADNIYPGIRYLLNSFSSVFPFSLYDLFIVIILVGLLAGIMMLFIKKWRKRSFICILFGLGWIYVAFYFLWGINYYSPGFLQRNDLAPVVYDSIRFRSFLDNYRDSLNANYTTVPAYTQQQIDSLIREGAETMTAKWKFPDLPASLAVKPMLFGRTYAAMGIRGYYGPFFGEAHINPYYLPHERPSVTIHELGHLAGITSEAEANLFAYLVATASADQGFRFSGYFSVFPYVLANARRVMTEAGYRQFIDSIDPRILNLYKESRNHWDNLYSDNLGSIQDWFYEIYLKNNNIPSGQANYSEVVGLLMTIQNIYLNSQK
ncbi:MAG: DUF3810 domain-containing protein [Bacteroidales bacterium]